jgi:membrane protein
MEPGVPGSKVKQRATDVAEGAGRFVPAAVRGVVERAGAHHTVTLAGGLAFFGILSIGPAIGVGFGLVRLVSSSAVTDAMIEMLQDGFPETLGLGELLEQMEDRAARYVGLGLLVLLWPATTLASGWTRALDAVNEFDSTGGVRGLWGRLRGAAPGSVLLVGLFLLVGAVTFGSAALGDRLGFVIAVTSAAVVLQFCFCLAIYRWLPSTARPLAALWPGALWATAGVVAATIGFALALTLGEGIAEQYPPTLTTAIILGLWLYAANLALLLGDEYNAYRRHR